MKKEQGILPLCLRPRPAFPTPVGVFHAIDEVSVAAMTESLVKHRRVSTNQISWSQDWTPSQGRMGPDGKLYSKKGVGSALLGAPFYWLSLRLPEMGQINSDCDETGRLKDDALDTQLYNLKADPFEKTNVVGKRPELALTLAKKMVEKLDSQKAMYPASISSGEDVKPNLSTL